MSEPATYHSYIGDHKQAYQDFIAWSREATVSGTCGLFIPYESLRDYFNEPGRLSQLLIASYPEVAQPHIRPRSILSNGYCRVFAILFKLGKGRFISRFISHSDLSDRCLPFIARSPNFPTASDGDLFEAFCKEQWMYCAQELRFNAVDQKFESECILPIISKEEIARGGSAVVHKITVHPSYDRLSPTSSTPELVAGPSAHTYALKTFHRINDAGKYYNSEVDAFLKLMSGAKPHPHIIGFYGSFEQAGIYNILLEYADGGTLEQYFRTTPPPTKPADIISFWSGLSGLANALRSIHQVEPDDTFTGPHVFKGWHQDIKPANVLIKKRKDASPYGDAFKLADLGTSHFKRSTTDEEAADRHTLGTRDYGAPECYSDEISDRSKLQVKQNVDIWSLGCVLSEAAVWVVYGIDGLKAYRSSRRKVTRELPGFKDSECFHNGSEVLDVVFQKHFQLEENTQAGDYVTKDISYMVRQDMLNKNWLRPTAQAVCEKLRQCLSQAATRKQPPISESTTLATTYASPSSSRAAPSLLKLPPELPQEMPEYGNAKLPQTPPRDLYTSGSNGIATPSRPTGLMSPPLSGSRNTMEAPNRTGNPLSFDPMPNGTMQSPAMHTRISQVRGVSREMLSSTSSLPHISPSRQPSYSWHNPTTTSMANGSMSYNASNRPFSDSELTSPFASMISSFQTTTRLPYPIQTSMINPPGMSVQGYDPNHGQHSQASISNQVYTHPSGLTSPQYSQPRDVGPCTETTSGTLYPSVSVRHPSHARNPSWGQMGGAERGNETVHYPETFPSEDDPYICQISRTTSSARAQEPTFNADMQHQPSSNTYPHRSSLPPIQTSRSPPHMIDIGDKSKRPSEWPVRDAMEWYRKRKDERHPDRRAPPPDENRLVELENRDMMFFIDDSETMQPHWQEVQKLFRLLAYIVKKTDKDGIEMLFTTPAEPIRRRTTAPLIEILGNIRQPKSKDDFQLRLGGILKNYADRLRQWNSSKNSRLSLRRCPRPSPLNLYIFTDGLWRNTRGGGNVTSVSDSIRQLVEVLIELKLPFHQVGIQFIRFGNDATGKDRLEFLDSRMGLPWDIVDTEQSDGDVWKMLLGPTNKAFDEDDVNAQTPHELDTGSAMSPSDANSYYKGWPSG